MVNFDKLIKSAISYELKRANKKLFPSSLHVQLADKMTIIFFIAA